MDASKGSARTGGFYLGMAVFMTATAIVGFWPTYFSPLLGGQQLEQDWVVHVHASISLGWMALLLTQTFRIARGQVASHMRLGRYGFALGAAVVLVGFFVAIRGMGRFVSAGIVTWSEAIVRAPSPLASISTFALLLAIGFVYRGRPDVHKRFMIMATVGLLFPATSRMDYVLGPWSAPMMFAVFMSLVWAHDVRALGRIHMASIAGTALLLPRLFVSVMVAVSPPPSP